MYKEEIKLFLFVLLIYLLFRICQLFRFSHIKYNLTNTKIKIGFCLYLDLKYYLINDYKKTENNMVTPISN